MRHGGGVARGHRDRGLLLVAVGLVVNVIAMTGVGNTLSLMIQEWAGGNLVIDLNGWWVR